ncbi:unnamed protein product [Lathyrus oleraceus]|uniref:uncharacterized protein LOC127121054 n=1 Tax=Pisum sativum TaxID=3888 RepID=UPI0021D380E0|nr:uncharacterized protein LOC127121054 [Pisum sativum]
MDTCQLKYQNIWMKIHNTKLIKFTQLFILVSLFSFIFSPSLLFVFLHYFKFYFSTIPFELYTHNIDKNNMFLLCNGLLVFVGLTKSFSTSSIDNDKPSNNSQYIIVEEEEGLQSCIVDDEVNEPMLERETEKRISEPDEESAEEEEEKIEVNIEKIILIDEDQGQEMKEVEEEVELFDKDCEEGDKESEIECILIEENSIEEEEEEKDYVGEEEEESNMLNTEELNKKFEDFIRKIKEDLRMDARRHLVMV